MEKYFRKTNGDIIKVMPNHDLDSLMSRFTECNEDGSELKKEVPKKSSKKKGAK